MLFIRYRRCFHRAHSLIEYTIFSAQVKKPLNLENYQNLSFILKISFYWLLVTHSNSHDQGSWRVLCALILIRVFLAVLIINVSAFTFKFLKCPQFVLLMQPTRWIAHHSVFPVTSFWISLWYSFSAKLWTYCHAGPSSTTPESCEQKRDIMCEHDGTKCESTIIAMICILPAWKAELAEIEVL